MPDTPARKVSPADFRQRDEAKIIIREILCEDEDVPMSYEDEKAMGVSQVLED